MARDHDKSIRALRKQARKLTKQAEDMEHQWMRECMLLDAAAVSRAAGVLAAITGTLERAAKKAKSR